jgi:hypothetical protein
MERPGALLARRTEEGMELDDLLCSRNAQVMTMNEAVEEIGKAAQSAPL